MGEGRVACKLPSCRIAPGADMLEAVDFPSTRSLMALFFDQKWFNARLDDAGLSHADLAKALGLTEAELGEMWKDQREILDREIGTMALLLGVNEDEVRKRGGIQGSPEARAALRAKRHVAAVPSNPQKPEPVEARLERIEARLDELTELLKTKD